MNVHLSTHFMRDEMKCHCGCDACNLDPRLLPALEALRGMGSEMIVVNDGYRCAKHNAEVGGVPHSQHPEGMAADIRIGNLTIQQMYDRAKFVDAFENGGIGVYDSGFMHVDVREGKARWSRKNGVYLGLDVLVTP